jgi:hypothetical protein
MEDEEIVDRSWVMERSHIYAGTPSARHTIVSKYISSDTSRELQISSHYDDSRAKKMTISEKPQMTIAKAIGQDLVSQSNAQGYRKIFATRSNLTCHYFQDHLGERRSKSLIPCRELSPTLQCDENKESVNQE